MKKYVFLIVIVFFNCIADAQTLLSSVIGSAGGSTVISNCRVQFTVGESSTFEKESTTLGFQSFSTPTLSSYNDVSVGEMNIYPNPVEKALIVNTNVLNSMLYLKNVNSQVIFSITLSDYTNPVSLEFLKSGVYFIYIQNLHGTTVYKIIKK